ncbi:MAG: PPOX class F420-dependent oxidoreductase [Dehalococcoidia bacterium]
MTSTLSEGVRKLFQGKNFAHVATLMPDGSPHVSPVWIDVLDNHLVFNSDESYVKVKNLHRDPRVAVSILDHEDPYRSAFLRGRVVEFRHEGAAAHIDKLAKKYLGMDTYPYHQPDEQRVIVTIEPERVASQGID